MPWMSCRTYLTRLAAVVVLVAACGEEPIGPDEFHRVGGYYAGPIEGTTTDGHFLGTIWMDLVQSEGVLTGTYDFNGDFYVTAHNRKYDQIGGGTVEGSLSSGPTPQVSLTLIPDDCPSRLMTYQGSYDDGRAQITISGTLLLSADWCNPLVSIPHRTILQR